MNRRRSVKEKGRKDQKSPCSQGAVYAPALSITLACVVGNFTIDQLNRQPREMMGC